MSVLEPEETKTTYTALYRQWRPQLFSQIVGQEHVTRTLQNALANDRVAHAYLFCGLRGTGKTTMAKLLAKALNCLEGVNREPCNRCRSCREVTEGRSMDVQEIDAASNRGIDEIRELRERVRYASAQSRYKVFIIDEVHMLTNEAFNALLKTLEEPPPKVVFILATTEIHKLPLTVVSRCQRFDFHLLQVKEIVAFLGTVSAKMNFAIEEETLYLLARLAEGSLRDALGFLEQCRAFGGEKISPEDALKILGLAAPETAYNLLQAVAEEKIADGLLIIRETVYRGQDLHRFIRELILYLRKLVILQTGADEEEILKDVPGLRPYLLQQKESFTSAVLLEMLEILQQLTFELKGFSQPQFLLELAFLRLVRAHRFRDYLSPEALFSRLEELEEKLEAAGLEGLAGRAPSPAPTPAAVKLVPKISKDVSPAAATGTSAEEKPATQHSAAKPPEKTQKLSPGELQRFWDERLLPELKRQRKTIIHAMLQESRPLSCEGGSFTVAFPSVHSVLKGRIESKEHSSYIESLLEQLLGKKMHFKVILQEKIEEGDAEKQEIKQAEEYTEQQTEKHTKRQAEQQAEQQAVQQPEQTVQQPEEGYFIRQVQEMFGGQFTESDGDDLDSPEFWFFSLEEIPRKAQEEDEIPF